MLTVVDNENLKISIDLNQNSTYATLCFTGIGHGLGGIEEQREEFLRASNFSTLIYIIDKTRSWGNKVDFDLIKDVINIYIPDKSINTLGNSMGGFLAILATRYIPISSALAFVPQFSVHPEFAKEETRWRPYVDAIQDWRHVSLSESFSPNTKYYVISGDAGLDGLQLRYFPNYPNIHKICFRQPSLEHGLAERLKRKGLLYDLISDCMLGLSAAEILRLRFLGDGLCAYIP